MKIDVGDGRLSVTAWDGGVFLLSRNTQSCGNYDNHCCDCGYASVYLEKGSIVALRDELNRILKEAEDAGQT